MPFAKHDRSVAFRAYADSWRRLSGLDESYGSSEVASPPPGFLEGSAYKHPVYSGSDRLFAPGDLLSPNKGREYGIYVSPNPRYAKLYGRYLYVILIRIRSPRFVEGKYEISPADLSHADAVRLMREGYDSIVVTNRDGDIANASEIVLFDARQAHIMQRKG